MLKKNGSSGRTRTYNPPVNSRGIMVLNHLRVTHCVRFSLGNSQDSNHLALALNTRSHAKHRQATRSNPVSRR